MHWWTTTAACWLCGQGFRGFPAPTPHAPDALYFFSLEQPLVGWQLPAQWGDGAAWQALCVFYNPTETSQAVPLPVGRWQMLSDGISSSLWRGPARVYEHEAVLMPYSATIFGQI